MYHAYGAIISSRQPRHADISTWCKTKPSDFALWASYKKWIQQVRASDGLQPDCPPWSPPPPQQLWQWLDGTGAIRLIISLSMEMVINGPIIWSWFNWKPSPDGDGGDEVVFAKVALPSLVIVIRSGTEYSWLFLQFCNMVILGVMMMRIDGDDI